MAKIYTNILISTFIITASNTFSRYLLFINIYEQNMAYRPLITSSEGPWARAWAHGTGTLGPWAHGPGPMGPGPWDRARAHGTGTMGPGPWDRDLETIRNRLFLPRPGLQWQCSINSAIYRGIFCIFRGMFYIKFHIIPIQIPIQIPGNLTLLFVSHST